MRNADHLAAFVRDALIAGRPRPEIEAALRTAGWTPAEISEAMQAWAEGTFLPPVPRPRPYVSAREAFVYGLMFVALAMTAWHLTALSFMLIDRWLPEPGQPDWAAYQLGGMRWSIATLAVFAPLFLWLNARILRDTRTDPGKRRSTVRKWVGQITLFLAAIALLGDLITVIHAMLSGDLTLRFVLKAGVVGLVAGAIFLVFRQETRGDGDAR
ncbi:DUF5671 domain-containing protein [Phaeovulum sp. NW3]|uniref:DUF5671 domain-containing protein n=1 Tax=Phaeovulum sp. NW3 TaxID=2934933 RepID=UPI0020222C73|nr:DUF5671 domain-containing protein [Phaeovulum sp. NW3]MCL7463785.1 DUF5671 domain-containing protein [Phaeovulum sp. NW3]